MMRICTPTDADIRNMYRDCVSGYNLYTNDANQRLTVAFSSIWIGAFVGCLIITAGNPNALEGRNASYSKAFCRLKYIAKNSRHLFVYKHSFWLC